jgi:hypothetical protein
MCSGRKPSGKNCDKLDILYEDATKGKLEFGHLKQAKTDTAVGMDLVCILVHRRSHANLPPLLKMPSHVDRNRCSSTRTRSAKVNDRVTLRDRGLSRHYLAYMHLQLKARLPNTAAHHWPRAAQQPGRLRCGRTFAQHSFHQ